MTKASSVGFATSIEDVPKKFRTDIVLKDIKNSAAHFSTLPSFISLFALRDLIYTRFQRSPFNASRKIKSKIPNANSLRVAECFGWRVLLSIGNSTDEKFTHSVTVHYIDRIEKKKAVDETVKAMTAPKPAAPPPAP
jgi:hypothetical protein